MPAMKPIASRLIRTSVCIVLTPLLTGCSERTGGEAYVEDLPRLELIEELRIGSVDDPDVGFSDVSDVVIGEEGLLYVLERAEKEVRVYDEGGALVRRFGGAGSGPGEFESPTRLGLLGDTLWVSDTRQQRLSLFRRDGTFINSYSPTPSAIEPAPGIHVMLRVGGLSADGTLTSAWAVAIPVDPPTDTFHIPIVRMDTTGAILDTIRMQPWAFPERSSITVGGQQVPAPGAPSTDPLYIDAPDGGTFVIERPIAPDVDTGVFTVSRTDASGDTIYVHDYRYRPRPWNDAAVDSLISGYSAIFNAIQVDPDAAAAELRSTIVLPAFQPGVSGASAGRDGSLWVHIEDAASARTEWIVLDPDGIARGAVALPRRTSVQQVNGEMVWVEEPDDVDVPWLVRYRVAAAESSPET